MRSDFAGLLSNVWLYSQRVDLKSLEKACLRLHADIKENQLKRPKTTKQFATVVLAETMTEEQRIWKDFTGLQEGIKEIVDKAHRRKKEKKGVVNEAEKKELDTLESRSEYYQEVLGHIADCKSVLVEYLAAQNPKDVARAPRKLKLVRECLPAWNVVRRLVESFTKGHGQKQYEYSVREFAAALSLSNIPISKEGIGYNDNINYNQTFGIKGKNSLYKLLRELDRDQKQLATLETKALEIISEYQLKNSTPH